MTEENTQTTEQPTAPDGSTNITINDMIVLKNMVEICSSRGAFKADEMTTVGGVYNKLADFIKSVMPPQPEAGTGNTAPATDAMVDTGNVATDTGNVGKYEDASAEELAEEE